MVSPVRRSECRIQIFSASEEIHRFWKKEADDMVLTDLVLTDLLLAILGEDVPLGGSPGSGG
jgi:hypothetical protein